MNKARGFLYRIQENKYIPLMITGLAGVLYTLQAWNFSRMQRSLLDEGNYLLKGYLFATGQYLPYQDFGFWTNKMPLAFLVPGYVQRIFGPGLLVGRNYAFALSVIILLLAVGVGYRLSKGWGMALTAVVLACNPAPIKVYTRVLTEGLTAAMLLLVLILILGKDRPRWQLYLGAFVAGLIPMTRINLLPVFPLVVLYLAVEVGWKKGLLCLLVGLVPILGLHLLYWPGILQIWAKWIPHGLIPMVDAWDARTGQAARVILVDYDSANRLLAISQGLRFHLAAIFGGFLAISLWPAKWADASQKRSAIFLLVLFGVLFSIHAAVPIFMDFNIHVLFRYLTAFSFLGVFLILATWQNWNFNLPKWRRFLILLGLAVLALLVGYSVSEQSSAVGNWVKNLLSATLTAFPENGLFARGWTWVDGFLKRMGRGYGFALRLVALIVPTAIVGLIVVAVRWFAKRKVRDGAVERTKNGLPEALIAVLLVIILLSPTRILGGAFDFYDCTPAAITHYADAANLISRYVDPGEQVFYIGKDTQAVLLELVESKGIKIYPQQLNANNAYYQGGNTEELLRGGKWNDLIAQEWLDRSQVLLFEEQAISSWFAETALKLDLDGFKKVDETNNTGCSFSQRIYVYRRP